MVRLILYNIEYCEGTIKNNWQYLDLYHVFRSKIMLDDRMIEFLEGFNPDILALIEVDSGGRRTMKRDQALYFSSRLGLDYMAHSLKYAKNGLYRLFRKSPVIRHQENALLTRFPLEDVRYHYLSKGVKRVIIEATIKVPEKITLLVAHLALFKKTRLKQLNELKDIVNNVKGPIILVGDFNTFKEEELQILLDGTRLIDSYSTQKNHKIKFTEPSWKPKYRLDNILVSPQIKINQYKIIEAHFSDHLPVMIDFEVKK